MAHAERRGWLVYADVNPLLDPLRGDPRFAAIVEAMRLGAPAAGGRPPNDGRA